MAIRRMPVWETGIVQITDSMDEAEQHSRCSWTELRAQQKLQESRWTRAELQTQRDRCWRLVEGDYCTWSDFFGRN